MDFTLIIVLILALLAGLLLGFFIALRQKKLSPELRTLREEAEQLRMAVHTEKAQAATQQLRVEELRQEGAELRRQLADASDRAARLETAKEAAEKLNELQRSDIALMQETFRKDFELLANRIFTEKSEKFNQHSRASIDQVLEPLKVRLKEFQEKVDSTHKESLMQASSLREEIKHLRDTGQRMSQEAENLTKALRNDSKVQGNWGEYILERIMENSGLVKGREYFIQQSFTTDDGRRLQPDVLVKLPEDKWIVVDSKVSLTAYDRFVNAEDSKEKELNLKAHTLSMRTHFKGLSGKNYNTLAEGRNLDFILMFIPIESAYLSALNAEPDLFNEAYDRGIVMVCPSTLLASLKIIASTWKHEYQNKNALEIATRGKLLLEKFTNFVEDLDKVGLQLERTNGAYQDAMNKLSKGRGNLITQAQQLEELGVKATKKISERT